MTLLPADIHEIKYGTGWMPFAPIIIPSAWVLSGFKNWSCYYHVELVWEQINDQMYKVLSMQPPLLTIVTRKFDDTKGPFFRLRERPFTDWDFWQWGNEMINKELYILGWQTCGHPVRDFYKQFGIQFDPYPGPIESYCKKSGRFVEVT